MTAPVFASVVLSATSQKMVAKEDAQYVNWWVCASGNMCLFIRPAYSELSATPPDPLPKPADYALARTLMLATALALGNLP